MFVDLGEPLPPGDEHAVSVSLPKWSDTEGWASRNPDVLSQLKAGYPRFYVPHMVRNLADRLLKWAAARPVLAADNTKPSTLFFAPSRAAMLFPDHRMARACKEYLDKCSQGVADDSSIVFHVAFDGSITIDDDAQSGSNPCPYQDLYMVSHPDQLALDAKSFWQHTGFGISSRFAAFWLENAPFLDGQRTACNGTKTLPLQDAEDAALALRRRIAGLYSTPPHEVGVEDVYLYQTGMSAIAHTALMLRDLGRDASQVYRVAVFGFLYVDTFKVLSKVHGFECALYGHASPSDMNALEADLESGMHIEALYTEFPGNPLLGSLDLERLYALSREYGFFVVVDDTIGTSVNLSLAPFCDVVCTSLTKMFSGACNVMGGSVVLSPQSKHHERLRKTLAALYVDTYFPLDVVIMEKNSADFEERVAIASRNAEAIAELLRKHPSVEWVYYPKGSETQHLYDWHRREGAGYGYLLSIRFTRPRAAVAFHDALDVAKGPSLGTNFTLACAYTLLAHYSELEWAAKYGVFEHLVRISIGIEGREHLERLVRKALAAAEEQC